MQLPTTVLFDQLRQAISVVRRTRRFPGLAILRNPAFPDKGL